MSLKEFDSVIYDEDGEEVAVEVRVLYCYAGCAATYDHPQEHAEMEIAVMLDDVDVYDTLPSDEKDRLEQEAWDVMVGYYEGDY